MQPPKNKKSKSSRQTIIKILLLIGGLFVLITVGVGYFKKDLYTVMKVPDFQLTDQNNRHISNRDMLGKVYLVEFFYSSCPSICPIMNNNIRYIEERINCPDFGVISISIDPAHDTPEFLRLHAQRIGVKSPHWHFLTGDRAYIEKIADQFNIYIGDQSDESESLNHSGMLALVDKKGNIRCRYKKDGMPMLYYSGLNYQDPQGKTPKLNGEYHPDREFLIEDIKRLLQE
ncbi:SCO family protein [Elizabethkingia argenteiflava]|nr:SCO family protein [Elizabethkingia argenteiflava]